jgi:type I restriction enzyme, S subunit
MSETDQIVEVGDICSFINGHGFKAADWRTEGLPIIRIQNLNGSKDFNYFNGKINEKWLVHSGDILFAWAGVKGVSFGPTVWNGPRGLLNQHIYRVEPKGDFNRRWIYAVLERATIKIEAKAHGFKTSLVHVHKKDITSQKIKVPSRERQDEIAEIINTWDMNIEKLERLLSGKKNRFKWFLGKAFDKSKIAAKRNFGSFLKESAVPGSDGSDAKKLTVKLYGKGIVPKEEKYPGSKSTKYYKRLSGQFIFSKLDFLNGAFGIIPPHLDGYESTSDLPAFDISPEVNPDWLLFYLTRPVYYTRQLGLARGQRKARRVNPKDFLSSTLPLPPRHEQDRIAKILCTAKKDVEKTRDLLLAFQKQKRGLMQKLLTGKIRVATEQKESMDEQKNRQEAPQSL